MLGLVVSGAGVALLTACGTAAAPVAPTSAIAPPTAPPPPTIAPPAAAPAAAPAQNSAQAAAAPVPTSATAASTPVVGVVAPPPQSAGAKSGGVLRMGIVGDLPSLDGNDFGAAFDVTYPIFNDLGQEDEKLNLSPELAESFELSSDSRSLKLNLRKGVQFHSGREMTSDDVKWEIDRSNDPKVSAGVLRAFRILLTSVETPDPSTVIIRSDSPWPAIADYIHVMNVLDPQTSDQKLTPIGTGPFKFQEYVQGDHLTLVKNPSYWKAVCRIWTAFSSRSSRTRKACWWPSKPASWTPSIRRPFGIRPAISRTRTGRWCSTTSRATPTSSPSIPPSLPLTTSSSGKR
jgi:ABC-type transport system substrate-binding protein